MPLTFNEIYRVVRLIPKGRVMSYSGVARQCGYPRAARQVGYAMFGLPHALSGKVPWWRVINAQGRISNAYGPEEQRRRLADEGVAVSDAMRVDMRKYDAEDAVYQKLRARAKGQASPR
jgi:methylated-DNA-protein-cysteine methyltransferase related protein